jgi:hypothetical protein
MNNTLYNDFLNRYTKGGLNNPLLTRVSKALGLTLPPYCTAVKLTVALENNAPLADAVKKIAETVTAILEKEIKINDLRTADVLKSELTKSAVLLESLRGKYGKSEKVAGSATTFTDIKLATLNVANGKKAVKAGEEKIANILKEYDLLSKKEWGLL